MKRTTLIIFLLFFVPVVGCAQPLSKQLIKRDTTMLQQGEVERYDFEATKNGTIDVITEQDGWILEKTHMLASGPFYDEYAPAKEFYQIQKWFYPSGSMRTKTSFLGDVVITEAIESSDFSKAFFKSRLKIIAKHMDTPITSKAFGSSYGDAGNLSKKFKEILKKYRYSTK